MAPHDISLMYSTKAIEYLIAVAFLILFIPFWQFVNGGRVAGRVSAAVAPPWRAQAAEWFRVPDRLYFHPGHAWARVGEGGDVTAGMDDFAQKLVGRPSAITLPAVGSQVEQGGKGWSLVSDGKSVDVLCPVEGLVVGVNEEAVTSPERVNRDPYGAGWLLTIRPSKLATDLKQLLSGALAKRWMEQVGENLRAMMSPDLGRVYQDGGVPVDGMARQLDPEKWDDVARRFFLT